MKFIPALVSLLSLIALSACSTDMLESRRLNSDDTCSLHSTGSYNLPKHLLGVTIRLVKGQPDRYDLHIERTAPSVGGANKSERKSSDVLTRAVEDRNQSFCLDYVSSSFSEDHIGVVRSPNTNLLQEVNGDAEDKSGIIINQVLDAGGELAASILRSGTQSAADPTVMLDTTWFDPFDRNQMQVLNEEIRRYGYCLFLSDVNDPFIPSWSPQLCDIRSSITQSWEGASSISHKPSNMRGIFYRPMLTHKLVVAKRADPDVGPFVVDSMLSVKLANAAPLLSVGVSRSMFVDRKTNLVFDRGVLENVTIDKPSQLNAFVDIPLKAVRVVVALPVRALAISTNRARNQRAIIDAQNQLLATMTAYEEAQKRLVAAQTAGTPEQPIAPGQTTNKSSTLDSAEQQVRYQECIDSYMAPLEEGPEACRRAVQSEL